MVTGFSGFGDNGVSWTGGGGDSMMGGGGDSATRGGYAYLTGDGGDVTFGGGDVDGSDLGEDVDGLVGSWLSSPRLDTASTTVFSSP